ncbi:MAG: hypothetical protein ACPGWR_24865 [Ardenticatenaceae bacterium]
MQVLPANQQAGEAQVLPKMNKLAMRSFYKSSSSNRHIIRQTRTALKGRCWAI